VAAIPYDNVRQPLRLLEAEASVIAKLGATPRAEHSRFVGALMRRLAELHQDGDPELWEIVGLLHDLDYFVIEGDWSMHGRITVAWLEGRLPSQALWAIGAHDPRSGVVCDLPIADALKLSDALAILDQRVGRQALLKALKSGPQAVVELSRQRDFHGLILPWAERLEIDLGVIAGVMAAFSIQPVA
jgi:hypothetical protein